MDPFWSWVFLLALAAFLFLIGAILDGYCQLRAFRRNDWRREWRDGA